ncbi:Ada metal-binding domain-containing protein [Saccharopolyspora gloriosae]|uniref:Ada metal-binding domain-containing protein n=1 Tax=Saccharopolyspora gloriosae TaxID=455344 RepID=UPI001FB7B83E|nr:Ada metal-binding domain-containing protein [Saccharopolyspora gloriosae]
MRQGRARVGEQDVHAAGCARGAVLERGAGAVGGHRRGRIYGRLDCRAALRAIARGGYVTQRVFFADEATARAAGYRPCAVCLPEQHRRSGIQ